MKFYVDENITPNIAQALAILQNPRSNENIEVFTIKDEFEKGTPDEEWIPKVAAELYRQHGLGVVFFKPPKNGYQYWDLVEFYIKRWKVVKEEVKKLNKPFALVVTPRSAKPDRL